MALDFILEHEDHRYLVTQQERLSYFFDQCGIDAEALPARLFRSNGTVTTRYFPDGFPQFLGDQNPSGISFVYVDDAQLSTDAFRAYLRNYQSLFQSLRALNLLFLTTSLDRSRLAERTLARFCARIRQDALSMVDLNRLLAHFPHRLLWENKATRTLNTAQMQTLAEDIHTLCGPQIDHLYAVWKESGAEGLRAECVAEHEASSPPQINLTSHVLEHDYDLFGTLHAAS